MKDGFFKEWYENGNLKEEYYSKRGEKDGFYNLYDDNGYNLKKVFFVQGKGIPLKE